MSLKTNKRSGVGLRELDERFALSYQPEAPDHGQPELALVDRRPAGRRYAILATGKRASRMWKRKEVPPELIERGKKELLD